MKIALTASEEANLMAHARTRGTTPESVVREAMGPILQCAPARPENADTSGPRVPKRHISRVTTVRLTLNALTATDCATGV